MTADEALAAIPYARFLGVRVEADAEGRVCVLPFREDLIGSVVRRALHGGVVGAFLELTALVEVLALGESQRVPKPINFSVNYLRPARAPSSSSRAAASSTCACSPGRTTPPGRSLPGSVTSCSPRRAPRSLSE